MTPVNSPNRRQDLTESLGVLMTITPATVKEWLGLTNAVHWLVDDTGWDLYRENGNEAFNPTSAIGDLLQGATEVAAAAQLAHDHLRDVF